MVPCHSGWRCVDRLSAKGASSSMAGAGVVLDELFDLLA